jgi:hypothetical protein
MDTTALNAKCRTQFLGGSTHAYDDGELEGLLDESGCDRQRDVRGAQLLSSEMLAQILAGGVSPNANGGLDGKDANFAARCRRR